MLFDDGVLMVDELTKSHRAIHIVGWFAHPSRRLNRISIDGPKLLASDVAIVDVPASAHRAAHQTFRIDALMSEPVVGDDDALVLRVGRERHRVLFTEAVADRSRHFRSRAMWAEFVARVSALASPRILAVGGRDRSGLDDLPTFGSHRVTVLDVVAAPEVDIVADVHDLDLVPDLGSFDAFFSLSVFEHLLMPWQAVARLNAVLNDGAVGFVEVPQSIGLHDMPWDFRRISDFAWDALFNEATGFEILDRAMDHENYVLPGLYRESQRDAELTRGFERSTVLVRKIGPSRVSWPVRPRDVISTSYPSG